MKLLQVIQTFLITFLTVALTSCGTFGPKIPMSHIPKDAPDEVRNQIVELYSFRTFRRVNAIIALGDLGSSADAAVPFLIDLLSDDTRLQDSRYFDKRNPNYISSEAAVALGKIGDPQAVLPLINEIKDKHDIDRDTKADALVAIGKRNIEPLIDLLKNEDHVIRMHAVKFLIIINDPRSLKPLIKTLSDEYFMVRYYSAQALGGIKDNRAVEPLILALDDRYGSMAGMAAWALGEIRDTRAVEPLLNKVNYEGFMTKTPAVQALMKIGTAAAQPLVAVINKKHDENATRWHLKENAVKLLGKLSTQSHNYSRNIDLHVNNNEIRALSIPVIIKSLKDENFEVRTSAIWALGGMQAVEAVEPLIALLKDDDESVRQNAAMSLGKIKDMRAAEPLIAALSDSNNTVQDNAMWALSKITGENFRYNIQEWQEWLAEHTR